MHEHITTNSQDPTQKFHEKLKKNPKFFEKPQNPGLNAWNAWEREDIEVIPQEWGLNKAENLIGVKIWEWERVLNRERSEFCQGEERKVKLNRANPIFRKRSSMDWGFYRGFVEH